MDATAESGGFAYSSAGKSHAFKRTRESVPITQGGKTAFGNKDREAFSQDKLKIATAQPMSRFQLQQMRAQLEGAPAERDHYGVHDSTIQ